MKRFAFLAAIALLICSALYASDETLRVDYIFSGDAKNTEISLAGLSRYDGWAGRRVNTDKLLLKGNGSIRMVDAASGKLLYIHSFSTLFREWQYTEEATKMRKSSENTYQLPMPDAPADVTVELYDDRGNTVATLTHRVDPSDILIRKLPVTWYETKKIVKSGKPEDCIDIAILAEGYTADEINKFYKDAKRAAKALFAYEPFKTYKKRFNIIAVASISADSGPSEPGKGIWHDTAVGSHFDTFYTERYLTAPKSFKINDCLAGLPYEHIMILVNTNRYGGGGVYNAFHISAAHHASFKEVLVHEFGHSFAGLGDEYYYDDQFENCYYPDVEPWEPNLTTKADSTCKWQDMIDAGVTGVGMYEGGGYMSKGVWRPAEDCRMKTNSCPDFCPVCKRAIEAMIKYYTEEQ